MSKRNLKQEHKRKINHKHNLKVSQDTELGSRRKTVTRLIPKKAPLPKYES